MCCTLAGAMSVALAQLVRRSKPHRLIIEPSGMGHPAGLIDALQSEHLRTSLRLQAVLVVVDVCKVTKTLKSCCMHAPNPVIFFPKLNKTYFGIVSLMWMNNFQDELTVVSAETRTLAKTSHRAYGLTGCCWVTEITASGDDLQWYRNSDAHRYSRETFELF